MTFEEINRNKQIIQFLNRLPESERKNRLWEMSDTDLWDLWRLECKDALIVLFKKYHRLILIRIYKRCHEKYGISLAEVQDAFSEFTEKILNGKYKNEALRKNFEAFSIYHTVFLIRTKIKKKAAHPTVSFEKNELKERRFGHRLNVEKTMDFGKILDCIPLISNNLYRNIIYLVLVLGYNVKDLVPLFGKRERAYDKKYRAMEAFKKILKREGLWEELKNG